MSPLSLKLVSTHAVLYMWKQAQFSKCGRFIPQIANNFIMAQRRYQPAGPAQFKKQGKQRRRALIGQQWSWAGGFRPARPLIGPFIQISMRTAVLTRLATSTCCRKYYTLYLSTEQQQVMCNLKKCFIPFEFSWNISTTWLRTLYGY